MCGRPQALVYLRGEQDGFAEAGALKSETKQHLPTCSDEESGCAPAKSLHGAKVTQSLQQPVPSQG